MSSEAAEKTNIGDASAPDAAASTVTTGEDTAKEAKQDVKQDLASSSSDSESLKANDGFEAPDGYYTSPFFIATTIAMALSAACGIGGFSLAASILTTINADIGPDTGITWVSLVYLVTQAVAQLIIGRLSDLFGRRWFIIISTIIGLVGSIVCATAQSVNVLIGGNTLVGFASAAQTSWPYLLNELVPMNWRFFAMGFVYTIAIPFTGIGPVVSYGFAFQTSVGWRGIYYMFIAIEAVVLILFVVFYFPPTFTMKHQADKKSKMEVVKNFDYVGLFLFTAGLVLLLLGLSWGGVLYAWKDAHVIATIVVGGVTLIGFGLWESLMPLSEPLIPMRLFKNIAWLSCVLLLSIGVSMYYAFYIVWPSQVSILYPQSVTYNGWLSSASSGGQLLGMIISGMLARPIGKTKYQLQVSMVMGAAFIAGCACVDGDRNKSTVVALLIIGNFCLGWVESLTLTMVGMVIDDQNDIGMAVGLTASMRSAISTVATAIFTTTLTNRSTDTIADLVPTALVEAGLPAKSVPAFLAALTSGSAAAMEKIPQITVQIIAAGTTAYKDAFAEAFSTVYLVTLAFSGLGIIVSLFTPNIEDRMTNKIAAAIVKAEPIKEELAKEKAES